MAELPHTGSHEGDEVSRWENYKILEAQAAGETGVWEWNVTEGTIHCSDYIHSLFGMDPANPKESFEAYKAILHPEDREEVLRKIRDAHDHGTNYEATHRIKTPEGEVKWIFARARVKIDLNGRPERLLGILQNVTKHIEKNRAIIKKAGLFQILTETSLDGFLQLDLEGNIIETNEAYSRMSGYSKDELRSMSLKDLEYLETPGDTEKHIHQLLRKKSEIFESVHRRKDNRMINVEISATFQEEEQIMLAFLRDVTTKKRKKRELQQLHKNLELLVDRKTAELKKAFQRADAKNDNKDRFLSRVSHELRTPLNSIIGFAQLMVNGVTGELNSIQKGNLEEILKAGNELLGLIEQILDFSSSPDKSPTLALTQIRCMPTIKECLEIVKNKLHDERIKVVLNVDENCRVFAEEDRFRKVLLGLISNAVKYNSFGGTLTVSAGPSPNSSFLRLTVHDTGRGISREYLTRIFEPFERVESEYDSTPGMGIGLGLAKKLVEEMGGNIGVVPREGEGSSFWIDLPEGNEPPGIKGETK